MLNFKCVYLNNKCPSLKESPGIDINCNTTQYGSNIVYNVTDGSVVYQYNISVAQYVPVVIASEKIQQPAP